MSRLTPLRTAFATLLIGAALAIVPSPALAHAYRCHPLSCEWNCEERESVHSYDRCMQRCIDRCYRRRAANSHLERRPNRVLQLGPERHSPRHLIEVVQRILAEQGGVELLAIMLAFLAWIVRGIRRQHNLRKAMECDRQANAHDHVAANLRAEADRLKHDL